MENIFEKIGLYDFFGLLLPGMSFVTLLHYMGFPLMNEINHPYSPTIKVIAFILLSYISGTLMQEIGSFLDDKVTKMRIKVRENFLDSNESIFEGEELQEVKKFINEVLKKDKTKDCFTKGECNKVFFYCKAYLENNEKMEKANKLDAIFAMSRDFIISNLFSLSGVVITIIMNSKIECIHIVVILALIASEGIFLMRAKRYAKLRVRTIIRQYISLKKEGLLNKKEN